MRYEFDGSNLAVMPDSPFLRTYRIDYVNLSRSVSGTVSTNTQIATSGTGNLHAAGTGLPAGTPITGTRVFEAIIPGRCAAPPAPAMITFNPRDTADLP